MFNEFEGNADERLTKQEERLRLLKNLRESGYFDEEGTEEVTVKATGVNPCDLGFGAFAGEAPAPEPTPIEFRQPMSVIEAERKNKRGATECEQCEGLGYQEPAYGDSAMLERCLSCGGSGRVAAPLCVVCEGQGNSRYGQACPLCGGQGLEPTQ